MEDYDNTEEQLIDESIGSEELYQQLVEFSPYAIFVHSWEKLIFANNLGVKLLGAPSAETLLKKPVIDFILPASRDIINETWRQVQSEGKTFRMLEGKLLRFDGTVIYVEVSIAPLHIQGKTVMQSVLRDVTRSKQAGQSLKKSHERFIKVLESLDAAVCVVDMGTYEILFVNQYMRNKFGVVAGEICWHAYHASQSGPCNFCSNDKLLGHDGTPAGLYSREFQNKRDGRWFHCHDLTIQWTDGRIVRLTIATDITKLKRMERMLYSERQRLFSLLDRLPAYVCLIARDHSFRFANRRFREHFGNPNDRTCYQVFRGKANPCLKCPTFSVFDTNATVRWEWTSDNGETYQIFDSPFTDLDGSPLVLGLGINITERKRVEQELRTIQKRLQGILEFLPDATFVIDQERKVVTWNRAMEAMTGVREEDIVGKGDYTYGKVFYKKPRPILIDLVFAENKEIEQKYLSFERKDHKLSAQAFVPIIDGKKGAYLSGAASPLYDDCGNFIGAIETIRDITEQKLTLEALRLSEERFSKIFHSSPCILVITRVSDNLIIDANDCFLNTSGYQREEVLGHTAEELMIWANEEDRAKIISMLNEKQPVRNVEVSFYTKTGELRHSLLSAEKIMLGGEECALFLEVDITQHKLMEKEIARLDRLNLVGEMAAGIGHKIRNPMTTVRGFLQMLQRKENFVNYKEYFEIMIGELDRANSIITEYLSLAKNKLVDLKRHNLNLIVETLLPLIQADAMNADKYVEVVLKELPYLLLDEKEIRQLILNLVRNGLEAMLPGGKLTIRTFTDGGDVVLSVQDQGVGMTPEVLDKIGTPFFTTKDSGTGLGLAVCYSIAARHHATIEIVTGPGETTFLVRFKAAFCGETN
ncbi:MAG: PAS domain S-box protein [Desulfotomaculaceae bacterium]|nr:PAS domain S-box protein [Desulfotomaculaceae bacterium]